MTPSDPLLAARALVLHDLSVRGLADPTVVSMLEEAVATRRWWVRQWAEGEDYVAGLVAQDVQDAVFDAIGRWPCCDACDQDAEHSLTIEPELGPDPHWVCSDSGIVVAPLGRL